jgi:hypothetical protein
LLTYSEQFDNVIWGNSSAAIASNQDVAPNGTTTADRITPVVATAVHSNYQGFTATAAAWTISRYVKSDGGRWCGLTVSSGAQADGAFFDVIDGVVGTVAAGTTATIQDVGNGWYRCSMTKTLSAATRYNQFECYSSDNQAVSWESDGTQKFFIWGAQVELGAFATSYIPTTNNPLGVTRAADQISILTSAFPYSATAGTSVFAGDVLAVNLSSQRVLQTSGSGRLIYIGGNQISIFDGTTVLPASGGIVVNTAFKAATAYGVADGMGASFNAGTVATDAFDGGMTSGTLYLGSDNAVAGFLNGHIKRLAYYASRKDNSTLQSLTV